ncbi:probable inactive histone-lysine N-methyltransferase SUVR2 [Camellia sinensis]|uniref:probable inactive histone-lysine N-methyltransferase SUVR2 n=1 Tax=Camellia sinensis TaxID=4442 RepID=UPI0010368700|nr:probable inactive histone-lysine N-methyltransferase SUVR2 [Camellia sinensis]
MAPNPRVARAFRAMRSTGIIEEKVKPVLKNLLKLYDKNWELIEEENYRALTDAIFDQEETQQEEMDEEAPTHEEPERPLKRLRLRNQNDHVSPSFGLGETSSRGPPKVEADLPETCPEQRSQDMTESPQPLVRSKRKQPVLPKPVSIQDSFEPSQPGAADRTEPFATRRTESIWFLLQYVSREKERNLSYLKLLQEFL